MSANTVVVKGVVTPNGTLRLEGNPELPVGPVEVVVRAMPRPETVGEDWWHYLQRARRELEAMNYSFMNEPEVTSWIEELRADDDRIERAYREANEGGRKQE